MSTQKKAVSIRFETKEVDAEKRTFKGLASTWNEDLGGDIIEKGAFKKTLRDWKASGRVMPLIDQHNYGSIRSVVGKMLSASETDAGLEVTFEVIDGVDGDEALRRIKGGFVDGLSIGYEAVIWEIDTNEDQYRRRVKEINLWEVSLVIWGMNPEALIDPSTVKAMLAHIPNPKDLRALASHIGSLLRQKNDPPAADPAADDQPADDEPEPPVATPDEADSQKAKDQEPYLYAEALQQRLLSLRLHSTVHQTGNVR